MINDPISRYKYTDRRLQPSGDDQTELVYFSTRESVKYASDTENQMYTVKAGDTLQNLAQKFFDGFQTPAQLWWILAEYQNPPIFDPTLKLEVGKILVVPSVNRTHALINERKLVKVL